MAGLCQAVPENVRPQMSVRDVLTDERLVSVAHVSCQVDFVLQPVKVMATVGSVRTMRRPVSMVFVLFLQQGRVLRLARRMVIVPNVQEKQLVFKSNVELPLRERVLQAARQTKSVRSVLETRQPVYKVSAKDLPFVLISVQHPISVLDVLVDEPNVSKTHVKMAGGMYVRRDANLIEIVRFVRQTNVLAKMVSVAEGLLVLVPVLVKPARIVPTVAIATSVGTLVSSLLV